MTQRGVKRFPRFRGRAERWEMAFRRFAKNDALAWEGGGKHEKPKENRGLFLGFLKQVKGFAVFFLNELKEKQAGTHSGN